MVSGRGSVTQTMTVVLSVCIEEILAEMREGNDISGVLRLCSSFFLTLVSLFFSSSLPLPLSLSVSLACPTSTATQATGTQHFGPKGAVTVSQTRSSACLADEVSFAAELSWQRSSGPEFL